MNIFSKFFQGLKKTKDAISSKLTALFHGELDDDFFEELEFLLISSDIGVNATSEIVSKVKDICKKNKINDETGFKKALRNVMVDMLTTQNDEAFPQLITFIGVNGVGKTTTIGKMAHYFMEQNKKVLMVAGDTFRAAASEQLYNWSVKTKCRIVKYAEGADPGAVVFDGVKSAVAKKDDVVLIDTAGRLHNKVNLMEELKKINKIIEKEWTGERHTYLVIDATTGQNALSQVSAFNEAVHLDGIVLTKLDGTAKGGVIFSIVKDYGVPVKFVGVGEKIDDIVPFNAENFVDNIL